MGKLIKHELIEIIIPAGSTANKFSIPDQPNLRSVKIVGIEFYDNTQLPFAPNTGNENLTPAQQKNVLLTLLDYTGFEFLKQAPVTMFKTIVNENGGDYESDKKILVGQIVNYPKSYITTVAPVSGVSDRSILFSVFYLDKAGASSTTYNRKS